MEASDEQVRAAAAELTAQRPRLVAIGASAGAVETLSVLLPALSPRLPAAIAVVVHLPAHHESLLPSLFAPRCAVPVREAGDKEPATPGAVFFAPPDFHLLVEKDCSFSLSVEPPVSYSRPSVDVFLESVAWCVGPRALGVVLSGANADGAQGLKAMALRGALTWVQTPKSAQADAMPRAAREAVPSSHLFTPEQMAEVFRMWGRNCGVKG